MLGSHYHSFIPLQYEYLLENVKFYVAGVGVCVVGGLGLVANVFTIFVLVQMDTNRNFNTLIIALSVVDAAQLVSSLAFEVGMIQSGSL